MHYPKKTNPKKKGRTPSKNMRILELALFKVLVIRLILGLYSKYFSMMSQANMQPNPINAS